MKQHNVLVPAELLEALRTRARREGLSVGELSRRILEAGVGRPIAGTPTGRISALEQELTGLTDLVEALEKRLSSLEELAHRSSL